MTAVPRRRHLPTSPFLPDPEPVVEHFEVGDLVTHDVHGMGRVVVREEAAVTVDFGPRKIRVVSPYLKLFRLSG